MTRPRRFGALALPLLLGACVSIPNGPSLMSLPGTGKNFDQFRRDDSACRQYANDSIGGSSADQAQADSAVKSAAVGTAVGAVAGAAIGGSGSAGAGAGAGLLVGALAGSGAANTSGYALQRRYDNAYIQCMYASGHKVPTTGTLRQAPPTYASAAPAGATGTVAPPPGYQSAQAPPPPRTAAASPPGAADTLFIYPRNGQNDAQAVGDRTECSRWATGQTGYDANRPNAADPRRNDFQRAMSACLDGRGYTVR